MGIYLDYNASAPIDFRVLDVMVDVYKNAIGNADSRTHDYGDNARKVVENARGQVASLLGVENSEVFFTSGSTESNNIAIRGLMDYAEESGKKHVITTAIRISWGAHTDKDELINELSELIAVAKSLVF